MRHVLAKYENIATGGTYYGFNFRDIKRKTIEGETYVEVTESLTRIRPVWVKMNSIKHVERIVIKGDPNVPK